MSDHALAVTQRGRKLQKAYELRCLEKRGGGWIGRGEVWGWMPRRFPPTRSTWRVYSPALPPSLLATLSIPSRSATFPSMSPYSMLFLLTSITLDIILVSLEVLMFVLLCLNWRKLFLSIGSLPIYLCDYVTIFSGFSRNRSQCYWLYVVKLNRYPESWSGFECSLGWLKWKIGVAYRALWKHFVTGVLGFVTI